MSSEEETVQERPKKSLSKQFVYYLVAAGAGYIVDVGTLYILHEFFGMYHLYAAVLGFIFGLIVVYIASSLFVFSDSKIKSKSIEIGAFAIIGVVGLGILTLFMWILADLLHINYLLAKILATIFVYLWNFFGRRALYHN